MNLPNQYNNLFENADIYLLQKSTLNQNEKVFVGLTNDQTIYELKKNGVQNGFFRSTSEQFNIGIIVVDKQTVFLVLNTNHIYNIPQKYSPEIFNYINHIIWAKANYEQCQGSLKKVDNARLSVVIPKFINDFSLETNKVKIATESSNKDAECIILSQEKEVQRKSKVSPFEIEGIGFTENVLYVNTFLDNYYPINIEDDSIYSAESFENKTVISLLGQKIWYKGNTYIVEEKEEISFTKNVPLDEINNFEPNFDDYEQSFNGIVNSLTVFITVEPIKLDSSYTLSSRYSEIQKVENVLKESISKLESMHLEEKMQKQLENIKFEKQIPEKIKMFNNFISNKDFGLDVLNNKKTISPIIVNEDNLKVPNELIGKLYTKQNTYYLATSNDHLADAKHWLKDNGVEAILIENIQ